MLVIENKTSLDKLNKRLHIGRIIGLREWIGVLLGSLEAGNRAVSIWSGSF